MQIVLTLFSNTVFLLLCLLETAVFVRIILGSFFAADDSALYRALVFMTEPLLLPVRALLGRLRINGGLLDLSAVAFSAAAVIIMAVLPAVTV